MPNCSLFVNEIPTNLGANPDTINKWITRSRMPAPQLCWLWKFLASGVGQWPNVAHSAEDFEIPAS
jgi:hypothetical protein